MNIERQGECHVSRKAENGHVSKSQETPRIAKDHQKLGERSGTDPPPWPQKKPTLVMFQFLVFMPLSLWYFVTDF